VSDHVTTTCCVCSEPICFTAARHAHLRQTGENFTCSRGHAQHFADNENAKLRKSVAELEERLQRKRSYCDNLEERYRIQGVQLRVQRGLVTRFKNQLQRMKEVQP
jgi:hypothetical protein